MSGRFEYLKFDEVAANKQAEFKAVFEAVEHDIEQEIAPGRYQALALTKLEEAYMWLGKAIRDDQVKRHLENPPADEDPGHMNFKAPPQSADTKSQT